MRPALNLRWPTARHLKHESHTLTASYFLGDSSITAISRFLAKNRCGEHTFDALAERTNEGKYPQFHVARRNFQVIGDPPQEEQCETVIRTTLSTVLMALTFACSSSDSSECQDACNLIEQACGSTTEDCVDDCAEDLTDCPDEMTAVLDCVSMNQIQCDPGEDQGLAEAPCEEQHRAVESCGKDPF